MRHQCLTPLRNAAIMPFHCDIEARERKIARRVVLLQIVAALVSACIGYSINGAAGFAAVLSGGGVSVVNGAMLAWRMSRASHYTYDAQHQLKLMYFYTIERFLVVVVLLCLCIAVLKLSPLEFLCGFVVGQMVLSVGRLFLNGFVTEMVANKNVK